MSYRVVVMVPSKERPGDREICFCELRYSIKRKIMRVVCAHQGAISIVLRKAE